MSKAKTRKKPGNSVVPKKKTEKIKEFFSYNRYVILAFLQFPVNHSAMILSMQALTQATRASSLSISGSFVLNGSATTGPV